MVNVLLFSDIQTLSLAFSSKAMETFFEGLKILAVGMSTVIGILIVFYLLIKLIIVIFPEKE